MLARRSGQDHAHASHRLVRCPQARTRRLVTTGFRRRLVRFQHRENRLQEVHITRPHPDRHRIIEENAAEKVSDQLWMTGKQVASHTDKLEGFEARREGGCLSSSASLGCVGPLPAGASPSNGVKSLGPWPYDPASIAPISNSVVHS